MDKKLLKPILGIAFFAVLILVIGIVGFIGLSRAKDLGSAVGQSSPTPEAPELLDCAEAQEQWCIVSSGFDADNNLLITLKAARSPAPDVYVSVREKNGQESTFTCQVVEFSPDTVYCLGPNLANEPAVDIQIRTVNEQKLLSAGTLILNPDLMVAKPEPTAALPAFPESFPTEEPTPFEIDSYPDPGESAYPNPAYPSYP